MEEEVLQGWDIEEKRMWSLAPAERSHQIRLGQGTASPIKTTFFCFERSPPIPRARVLNGRARARLNFWPYIEDAYGESPPPPAFWNRLCGRMLWPELCQAIGLCSPSRCGNPSGNTWGRKKKRRGRKKEEEAEEEGEEDAQHQQQEEASWKPLGALSGPPGSFLGASWKPLGGLLGPLGGPLKVSWGPLWPS